MNHSMAWDGRWQLVARHRDYDKVRSPPRGDPVEGVSKPSAHAHR
jgi:hypothetical protein